MCLAQKRKKRPEGRSRIQFFEYEDMSLIAVSDRKVKR